MEIITLHDKSFRPFISEREIAEINSKLGQQITEDYQGKKPLFLIILNGAFMFASDLLKNVKLNADVSFVKFASYVGTSSSGNLKELIGLNEDLEDRDIIIIEDIVDIGNTMENILDQLKTKNPSSIAVCSLLFKPNAFQKNFEIDYIGKNIGNDFVVGYGLDYDGLGRNLKEIYVLNS